ncbi:DUF2635 domain-containing protein [Cupriavidus taiwanensis]|uniref:DUF2635 domain-containing protein n=1 Tax=Cupriavidus taiwanensis TaxID=164546 RepID=UPI002541C64F|nr:DUF2635 domain-containing protein [Cupriavidus taiwanensis]MDK3025578.1 DUF2635 domain-containing protein [Cupriavidus taiwanensis]
MKVKAAPGLSVPKEHSPREYITDDKVATVERSAYYVRRVLDGDLVEVDETPARKRANTGGT